MPFGDGRADKTPQELLDRPDVADMFHWPYVFDGAASPASEESDGMHFEYRPEFLALKAIMSQ